MIVSIDEFVEEGRAALRTGGGAGARRAFQHALTDPSRPFVLEGLARAAYLDHDYRTAIDD